MASQQKKNSKKHKCLQWFSGNIRRKLTLFIVVVMLFVAGLFWTSSVRFLKPAYENIIRQDAQAAVNAVVANINNMERQGIPIYSVGRAADGSISMGLSDEVVESLSTMVQSGVMDLENWYLDIGNQNKQNLLFVGSGSNFGPMYFGENGDVVPEGAEQEVDLNGEYVQWVRTIVMEQGYCDIVENNTIVVGATAMNGEISVIMASNSERIVQAQSVLNSMFIPLSMVIVLFSCLAAGLFIHWFTRPITRLSEAAREMAKGNYNVRVDASADDEIGELSRDFNRMAQEVGRSAELQRDILANVSHDLRTPLTLIKGYAETVRDLTGDNPDKRTEQLNVIVDESDRLSALVGSVLELSRMSSGSERAEPVLFDLYDLGDELAYRYEEICRQQGGTFLFSGDEGCVVYADPGLVERALHNLLGNAIKHVGEDGFVGLKVYRTSLGTIRAEVSDHGLGISAEDLPHIFDKYYRSRADTGKPGTGLGLSITKAIFEAQNIEYGVITETGKGSTFWFEMPPIPQNQ